MVAAARIFVAVAVRGETHAAEADAQLVVE